MSTKPNQKKTPFIVEPLDWVAPGNQSVPVHAEQDEAEQNADRQPEQAEN
jgi:hypothetical protein